MCHKISDQCVTDFTQWIARGKPLTKVGGTHSRRPLRRGEALTEGWVRSGLAPRAFGPARAGRRFRDTGSLQMLALSLVARYIACRSAADYAPLLYDQRCRPRVDID
jgi:hypothetical protein